MEPRANTRTRWTGPRLLLKVNYRKKELSYRDLDEVLTLRLSCPLKYSYVSDYQYVSKLVEKLIKRKNYPNIESALMIDKVLQGGVAFSMAD